MKDRAQRYLLVYVLLLVGLAGARYATQGTYRELIDLQSRRDELLFQRATLNRSVAGLESASRIREWATKHDMVPYTKAPTEHVQFAAMGAPKPAPPKEKVRVSTRWR